MTKNYQELKAAILKLSQFVMDNLEKEITLRTQAEFNALYNEYANQLDVYSSGKIDDETLKSLENMQDPVPENLQTKYFELYEKLENAFYATAPTLFEQKN